MTQRLLLVEQSATMQYVIKKHAESLGFTVDARSGYTQAAETLSQQFQKFGAEFAGVIFGWPTTPQDDASAFAEQLETSDHKDLPVVVMSNDMRAETRAWVAGRDKTKLLAWKAYQELDDLLKQLIDVAPTSETTSDSNALAVDKSDVHLLVVDDSATIRYSLRDLFHKQGYRVTLAATHDEALGIACETGIDIAILDYYLAETTGDALCRELLASDETGDIICTVLTGTYSDHIIKRSLRAGAIECMFKNETSDLLVSRIDALSRFVCQRRIIQNDRNLFEDALESVAGAVILVNSKRQIDYINGRATKELGLNDRSVLTGQSSESLLEDNGPRDSGDVPYAATWRLPDGTTVDVDYQHSSIKHQGYSLLRFAPRAVPIGTAEPVVLQQSDDSDSLTQSVIRQFSLSEDCKPFLLQLLNYLNPDQRFASMQASLLILDVFPADNTQAMQVHDVLLGFVAREAHVVALQENRYGFLLRHTEPAQAYVLTRKVMQHCLNSVTEQNDDGSLVCRGSLLSLTRNASHPINNLIQHAFKGMELVNAREPNQALLLDVRRMLSAFPVAK